MAEMLVQTSLTAGQVQPEVLHFFSYDPDWGEVNRAQQLKGMHFHIPGLKIMIMIRCVLVRSHPLSQVQIMNSTFGFRLTLSQLKKAYSACAIYKLLGAELETSLSWL